MNYLIVLVGIACILSTVQANICKNRGIWGNTCKTCSERVYCMEHAGEWKEIPLETCDPGYICEDSIGACIRSNATCYSPALHTEFNCQVEGIFPDPLNCKFFYVCFSTISGADPKITFIHKARQESSPASEYLQAVRLECPTGKFYSARTQSCSLREEKATCTTPVCLRPGQQAAWPDDDELFYVCTPAGGEEKRELYPLMLRCSAGERFNGARCVRAFPLPISTTTTRNAAPMPQPGETITTQSVATTPKITAPPEVIFSCTRKGLSPHPSDCRKYYYCDSKLAAQPYSCPEGQKFSAESRSCIKGQC